MKANIAHARDPNLRNSMAAIRRAAQRAREVAVATHTGLIVANNGEWRRIEPAQVQETAAGYESDLKKGPL
ncbi:MAG TPA: hypothetical protein VFX02_12710 [Gammaproteobacteria bacterium]|nr:hypothetical protein [Gammaproteobacteria bacterium]